MYEHLRKDYMNLLSRNFKTSDIDLILGTLDRAVTNYEITEKSTELEVYTGGIPREVNIYLQTLKLESKSDGTIKLYGLRLYQFFTFTNKSVQNVEANDIRNFLVTYQEQRKVKDVTLEKTRQILNGFLVWCVNEAYINRNPCINVRKIKVEYRQKPALTRFQLELLRRACKNKRERALVEALYSTGARATELCNMKISQINQVDKSIEVLGKGKKYYTVYFNEPSQIALDEYIKERKDDSDWLFVTSRGVPKKLDAQLLGVIFRRLSKRLPFSVTPHTMRHTFATLSRQSGAPIDVIQKALNHSSVSTTQRYVEMSQDEVIMAHKKYVI